MGNQPGNNDFSYAGLEHIFEPIARCVRNYCEAFGISGQLAQCGPDEIARMAHDLRLRPAELVGLARKGPEAARLLPRMLVALGIDPKNLAVGNAAVLRDLQRLCIACGNKRICLHRIEGGTAAENYADFCPNAYTLDALFKSNSDP